MVGPDSHPPELSVVVPVYNEEENLPILARELREVLDGGGGRSYEILYVDDGSRDGSPALLRRLAREDPRRVRVITFRHNAGLTAAFDAGFRLARGGLVVTLDSDLQNDPADIPLLLRRLEEEGADAVVGVRVRRRDRLLKRVSSRIANAVRNRLTGDRVTDTGCSLKLYRRECLARLKLFHGLHRFLPTLLRMEGFRVVEQPVGHRPRIHGLSKYNIRNRVFRAFHDLLAVRWMQRRALRYEIVEGEEEAAAAVEAGGGPPGGIAGRPDGVRPGKES